MSYFDNVAAASAASAVPEPTSFVLAALAIGWLAVFYLVSLVRPVLRCAVGKFVSANLYRGLYGFLSVTEQESKRRIT